MRHAPVLIAIVAAVAVGVGVALRERAFAPPVLRAGTALPEARSIADFSLTGQDGEPFTREDLRGHWTLLFTGFTNCPDVCPGTLALMAGLRHRLARDDVRFLFVSVDPARDSPEVIRRYLAHFGTGISGATGAQPDIERFTAGLGLAQVVNPGAGGEYSVDHSTALVLIDPRARLAGYFQAPHEPTALAADLAALPNRQK
jgi:protein SCO1/2